jgi:hypothetical protein
MLHAQRSSATASVLGRLRDLIEPVSIPLGIPRTEGTA